MRKTLCERDHTVHMEFKAAVRVGGEQWIVSRRFKQFYALHKHLKSAWPDLQWGEGDTLFVDAPKGLCKEQTEELIRGRLGGLDRYMRGLSMQTEVWRDSVFREFVEADRVKRDRRTLEESKGNEENLGFREDEVRLNTRFSRLF